MKGGGSSVYFSWGKRKSEGKGYKNGGKRGENVKGERSTRNHLMGGGKYVSPKKDK